MPLTPDPNYKCTQAELYSVCSTIADNLSANLVKFTTYKAKYNAAFVTALRAQITAAEMLPDEEARSGTGEQLRVQLIPLNDKCLDNMQDLKGYIDIFPEAERESMYGAAGLGYYRQASNKNWEYTKQMNNSANNFIAAHSVQLLDLGNNMPATFTAQVAADAAAFAAKYTAFKTATTTGLGTQTKILANNSLNDAVTAICRDSVRALRGDAAKLNLFVFNTVLDLVSPPGSASLNVSIVLDESGDPAVGAIVTVQRQGTPVITNVAIGADGKGKIESANPGIYQWTCALAGRVTQTGLKDVNTGIGAQLKIRMKLP